jgi:hypothetical protein
LKQSLKHFVAYHNSDEYGPYYKDGERRARRGEEHSFFTAKNFREETVKGNRIWAFEGTGSPKRYWLVGSGTISTISKQKRPTRFRKGGREYGRRLHFVIDVGRDALDVTDLVWFRKLLRNQQSFRYGFNPLVDDSTIRALEALSKRTEARATSLNPPDLLAEVAEIKRTVRSKTTRKALIEARLGQGQFRSDVARRWGGRCAVIGCGVPQVLRASHIKPWSQCTNRERLDPANGLLLAAHLDALFDRGLISFDSDGVMLVSDRIAADERKRLRLPRGLRRRPTKEERRFLEQHRRYLFFRS